MQIHVARDGQQLGQFPRDEVEAGLASGRFLPTDLAWSEGQPDWVAVSSFPGLSAARSASLPPDLPSSRHRVTPDAPSAASLGPPRTSGLAIASLVFGVLSVTILPILAGLPAVICGHVSRAQIKKAGDLLRGDGLALAGLIMGYLSFAMLPVLAILAGIALPVFNQVQVRGKEVKSLSNAKQIALACKLYAMDNGDAFPATLDELVPDYLPDPAVFICPMSGPDVPMGYEYFGGKDTDPPEKVLLVSKAADRRGRRVVVRVDVSGQIQEYQPGLPAP